ncbi:MAG TPA: outer membrane beta-barrel protein [Rubricoccaceae bacterium]|jgi:opacity protein-like surface antigen
MRLLLLALVLLPVAASAQRSRPIAERGDLAFVVGVSGLNVLALQPTFGGVGLRYRVSDRSVVGASVGVEFAASDQDQGETVVSDGSRRNVRLALWNENHLGSGRRVASPFVGAGVTFAVGDEEYEREAAVCTPDGCGPAVETQRQSASSLSFGAGVLLGAEVRVARGITLGAAYVLGATVSRSEYEQTSTVSPVQEGHSTSVQFGTGMTDLHLSVYF